MSAHPPNRRRLLQAAASVPIFPGIWFSALAPTRAMAATTTASRVRPGDPGWPSAALWNQLAQQVQGRLVKVQSPLTTCLEVPAGSTCAQLFKAIKNPYFLGDEVALTQTLGWVDAWTSKSSTYAVAARTTAAARDTAMNPAVLDAFALVICAANAPPAYPGVQGHEPDVALARRHAQSITSATDELRKLVPDAGSYVSESNFFEPHWQQSFWGSNYPRLLAVKKQYDPDGLFFVHHGVGSEDWSADGFTQLA